MFSTIAVVVWSAAFIAAAIALIATFARMRATERSGGTREQVLAAATNLKYVGIAWVAVLLLGVIVGAAVLL